MSMPLFPEVAIIFHINFTGKIADFICLPLNRGYEGEDVQRLKRLFPNISRCLVCSSACLSACLPPPPSHSLFTFTLLATYSMVKGKYLSYSELLS